MAITTAERTQIEKLLVLMFNAAPGATYLSQVVSIYESQGHNLQTLANTLDDIPAFNSLHPNFQTAAEFAADFLTPLGLQNDAVAKSFVMDKFTAGVPKGEIMYEGLLALDSIGAGAAAQYVAAKAILQNKAEVSEYYSVTKGVAQTDINTLQLVLNGITSDHATVVTAESEIDSGTRGTSGIEVSLTPSQDSIVGTASSDTIHGLFGDVVTPANNTFTAGDSVDGAAGSDRLNLVALGTGASGAITVKNVEAINIQDTVGATFNALLVENAPGISFTSTVAGNTSMVTNAALASVMGLSGKGNLTVDYSGTNPGTADTANLSLNGAGTSTTARSAVNVADGNTIEKINVVTAGSNFVTLTGGTVAGSLVVTGAGTNNFSLSAADSLAAVATIDASASTGTNTFAMGGNLNTGTTIKGGTGADTVSTTLSSATLVNPNITGVETLNTTFTAAAVVDLGTATGLTSVGVSASTANIKFQNAQATVANLAVTTLTTVDSTLTFGYGATTKGDLALKLGSTAGAVDLGLVTLSNTNSVAISTVGALVQDADGIKISGNQTAVGVTVGAAATLTTGTITDSGNVGAFNVTVGANSDFSGGLTVAAGKNVGDVTLGLTGNSSVLDTNIYATGGDVGNVTLTATGNTASGWLGVVASGGSIGNISVSLTGNDGELSLHASAGSVSGGTAGDIGNVTISVTGDDNLVSGRFNVSAGDVGNISMTVVGDGNNVGLSGDVVFDYQASTYAFGGNVGDMSISVNGNSSGYLSINSSGGGAGNINIAADNDAHVDFHLDTASYNWYSGAPATGATVGSVSLFVGSDSAVSGSVSANGGDIGNVAINVAGDNASGWFNVTAAYRSGGGARTAGTTDDYDMGGNVGNISVSIDGNGSTFGLDVTASGGDIGTVAVSVNGNGSSGYLSLRSQVIGSGSTGGDIGAINITLGDATGYALDVEADGAVGALTVTGGDSAWFALSGGGGYTPFTVNPDSGTFGAMSFTFGDDSTASVYISGFSGSVGTTSLNFGANGTFSGHYEVSHNVGAITGTFGAGGRYDVSYSGLGGSIGATSLTMGAGSTVYISSSGGATSMGKVTLTGGDSSSSAGVYVSDTGSMIATMGGVDASAWLGVTGVDLEGVTLGTTVRVGAAGSWTRGTEGADNIFLGAGQDEVTFDTTPTAADVLFSFTVGAGKDDLDISAAATALKAVMTANAAVTLVDGDIARLVDIAGGQDITTAAGLATALETGEYIGVDVTAAAHVTIVTAASSTASTFYVFDVTNDATAGIVPAEVVLVGVVNGTAASAIGNLVLGNFA